MNIMNGRNLGDIKGVIWDLDDTLYSVTPALHASMRESVAAAVVEMGYPISYDEALKMAEESQKTHRLTVKMLVEKFDIDHHDLHIPFHKHMDHNITEICADLPAAFQEGHKLGMQHVIMTHASRDWAIRMLDRMGIADFFKAEHVFGLEDIDFEKKEISARATNTGLEVMGVDGKYAAFAEDRAHNLTIPHNLGLATILIDHPSQPRELPLHVNYRFDRAADFMNEIVKSAHIQTQAKKAV